MNNFLAIIYGIVHGLSEFLPVSGSAHQIYLNHIFKLPGPGISLELMFHLGSALALLVYFHEDRKSVV